MIVKAKINSRFVQKVKSYANFYKTKPGIMLPLSPVAAPAAAAAATVSISAIPGAAFVVHFGLVQVKRHVDEGLCQSDRVGVA